MLIFALLVVSLLCLAFSSTRLIGIIGLMLVFYLHPPLFWMLLILGSVALYFYYH